MTDTISYDEYNRRKGDLEHNLKLAIEKLPQPSLPEKHYTICEEQQEMFKAMFKEAGFTGFITTIPNQYWGNGDMGQRPWYKFMSRIGNVTIGWTKNVISIEWDPKSEFSLADEFGPYGEEIYRIKVLTQDDVTHEYRKERAVIHAWKPEKALEYLKLLRVAMEDTHE